MGWKGTVPLTKRQSNRLPPDHRFACISLADYKGLRASELPLLCRFVVLLRVSISLGFELVLWQPMPPKTKQKRQYQQCDMHIETRLAGASIWIGYLCEWGLQRQRGQFGHTATSYILRGYWAHVNATSSMCAAVNWAAWLRVCFRWWLWRGLHGCVRWMR